MSYPDPTGLLWQCAQLPHSWGDWTRCNSQVIVNQTRKKLNKLRDFTLNSVSLVFEAILGWASIRHGAFIRGECLIQSLHLRGGVYWIRDVSRLFGRGRLWDRLRLACCSQTRELEKWRHYANRGELDPQRVSNTKNNLVCKTKRLTWKFYLFIMPFKKRLVLRHVRVWHIIRFSRIRKCRGSCFPHLPRIWKPSR